MKKGFTILELLVVIAIIGVLATIVLAVTGDARSKGGDAAVKSNLQAIRTQSGIFYADNGLSYLPSGGSTFALAACPAYNVAGTNMFARDLSMNSAIVEATARGSGVNRCYNSSSLWAVAVGLKSNANASWCIDSGGASKSVAAAPATAINGATFVCN
jgi:prepilin-type N-terminal cleavage/methylation domain-containing protein